jgi:alkylmercury lyase
MTQLTKDEVLQAWTADYESALDNSEDMIAQELRLSTSLLQVLAEGKPVSATLVAEQTGLSLPQIEAIFKHFAQQGGEFDADGNLVGAALTLNPTPHHFDVDGQELYAWCSLDTIFLPGLIDRTAEVTSTDPITGEMIRLTVTPEGVATYSPDTTVLSITVPGISCSTNGSCGPETGPESEACSQMHFFASRESAETWLKEHPGVAILTVDEAWQLAKANWLDRRHQLQVTKNVAVQCAC